MTAVRIIPFLLLLVAFQEKDSVTLFTQDKKDHIEVFAHNADIYPVTIEVFFNLENLKANKKLPYITTLNPNQRKHIVDLMKMKDKNWNFESSIRYYMGSIYARHDDRHAYTLPFAKGAEYRLTQGFNGRFSHKGDLRHALDFQMKEGTEVYAARAGKVVTVTEKYILGGGTKEYIDYANYITIIHDDGTFGDYSHLRKNGAVVSVGDNVSAGQLIGYSGSTGFATGPHLHFVVKKTKKGGGYISIPVKFTTKSGIIFLREGNTYRGY
ncbi:MAG: M23 family metallopeptidase [Balneolaceae bacterium]|nr:M23 family metallopeptidase [Balneolaceae bacterium]